MSHERIYFTVETPNGEKLSVPEGGFVDIYLNDNDPNAEIEITDWGVRWGKAVIQPEWITQARINHEISVNAEIKQKNKIIKENRKENHSDPD